MVVFKVLGWSTRISEDEDGKEVEVRTVIQLVIWPDGRQEEIELGVDDEYHLHP